MHVNLDKMGRSGRRVDLMTAGFVRDFLAQRAFDFSRSRPVISTRLLQIEEYDDRRIPDGYVMAGEVEAAGFTIHPEDGDVVAALIAAIEELAGRVEAKAARIVPARPFFADVGQSPIGSYGKKRDAVVQSIARIDKSAIDGD